MPLLGGEGITNAKEGESLNNRMGRGGQYLYILQEEILLVKGIFIGGD